ncbi:unnamed protein product [Arctogadus glacialis]
MSQENWAFEPDVPQENHGGNELESEENAGGIVADAENPDLKQRRAKRELKYLVLSKGMSVCYAASIGGMATLTGTTPNVILKGQLDTLFPGNGDIINFASWFCFSFPTMLLMLIFSWLLLQFMYLGFNMKQSFGCGKRSANEREAHQVMKEEYKKLGSMGFAEGSVHIRAPGLPLVNPYVTDGSVANFMSSLFFCIPSELPRFLVKHTYGRGSLVRIDTATAIKLAPLYVVPPCTLCASMAFMLPVSIPPNAIAFSSGNLKGDILYHQVGTAIFNLNNFTEWAHVTIQIP